LQQRLTKAGGRLVKHAPYYWLPLTAGYLTRRLFKAMLRRSRPCQSRPAEAHQRAKITPVLNEERANDGSSVSKIVRRHAVGRLRVPIRAADRHVTQTMEIWFTCETVV
jgi:hypothetical protein